MSRFVSSNNNDQPLMYLEQQRFNKDLLTLRQIQTSASGYLINATSADGGTFTVDYAGNVGIGVTTATAKLHVNGSILVGATTGSYDYSVGAPANNPSAHVSSTVPTNITYGNAASMVYHAVRNVANTFNDEYLTFHTHQGGISQGERMRITPAGNVGIGTNNPGSALEVNGTVTATNVQIGGSNVIVNLASGTVSLGTSAITSNSCATVITTAATGVATTDIVDWGFNGDPTAITGYAPSSSGMLSVYAYPSAGNVNFKVCNPTLSTITPGAITLNWRVRR